MAGLKAFAEQLVNLSRKGKRTCLILKEEYGIRTRRCCAVASSWSRRPASPAAEEGFRSA